MTIIHPTKGANGTSGAHPTAGANGTDAIFTQNGKIGADSLTVDATGADGGDGGAGTGGAAGANGGKGGNAAITLNGNIFNAPATTSLVVALTATGGDGGVGGAGTPAGTNGVGGNGTVTVNGNIIQPNKAMTNIELDAIAHGGSGISSKKGNATATLNGNIVQPSKGATSVTLKAQASNTLDDVSHDGNLDYGTKTATLNGNIVQGSISNVTLQADATPSNGTANLNGNIIQTNATNTGTVILEASGNHISITNNKVTLGQQAFDLTVNSYSPYDATIKDNTFTGTGTNAFVFTDNAIPGPHHDTVSINLATGTFVFDGQNNTITGFNSVTVLGSGANVALTGGPGNDTLIGGDGDDTIDGGGGNDTIFGGKGNDILTGGEGNDILHGNDGDDTLDGGNGDDTIFGGAGDDTLIVSGGVDTFDGNTDPLGDTVDFRNATSGVTAYIPAAPVLPALPVQQDFTANGLGKLTFTNVQNLTGSAYGDTLTGDDGVNRLNGGAGNDTLTGGKGDDILDGGAGTGDVAKYNGAYLGNGYTISPIVGGPTPGIIVTDNTPGRDGSDTVTNVETLLFTDGSYDVASAHFTPNGPVNAAPTATNLNTAETYTEDTPLNLTDIVVSDVDSPVVTATLTLSNAAAGALSTGTSGAATSTYNTGTGVWAVTGAIADVNALLASATFVPAANFNGNFTITTSVSDGVAPPVTGSKAVTGIAVNDAPTATITMAAYAATEQTALVLKGTGLSIADVDAGAGIVTAQLSVGEGTLTVTAGTSGAIVTNSGTSIVTISGTVSQINDLLNGNATSTVSYIDGSDTPSASTNLTLSVNDGGNTGTGGALTGSATKPINITATNDAPTATITMASYAATEQTALDLKNSGMSIADVDAGAGIVTALLSVGEGTLTVTAGTSGATVTNSGTSAVTISGTLAQINALLNTNATSTVSYIDSTDTPSASTNLTLSVNDGGNTGTGGALTGSATKPINITAVNDAPVATITPPNYAVTENVALNLKNSGMSVSDVDAGTGNVSATLSVTEGTLTVTAGTSGAGVSGNGTGTVTLTGTLTQINALLNTDGTSTVSYTDNINTPAHTGTLTLAINDNGNTGTGGPLTASDTAVLNIAGTNTAPVLDNNKTPVLATEGENSGVPGVGSGTLVSSLVNLNPPLGGLDNVTDADPSPQTGIALTATDTTNGSWLYSTDNGANWTAVGTVLDSSALLLAADNNTRLYFQPNANYSGTDTGAITFRAWDQSTGSNGTTADTSVNGGNTAFSTATDTADITIDPVRIGNNFYATINDALAAAQDGDTIYVQPGEYDESLLITKQVNIVGLGNPGDVVIKGNFRYDNGTPNPNYDPNNHNPNDPNSHATIPISGSIATWLKTATGYIGDTGITVNADNVTLNNLTVEDFKYDIGTQNNAENSPTTDNSVANLALNNVFMKEAVTGFQKDDGTTLNGLTITGGGVSDSEFGVYLSNNFYVAPTLANPDLHDARDVTIDGADFSNILWKGIYTETLRGDTTIANVTMNDVGNFGGTPVNNSNLQKNGNGIDINLKYHTYDGTLDLTNNHLTNTGNTIGQNGAIVVEGRDDPGNGSYDPASGGHAADVSNLIVTITGGTIDGGTTGGNPSGTTGVRIGELGKADSAHNVTGPDVTINGTVISNMTQGEIENHSHSLMTVIGTNGDDVIRSDQTAVSTGPIKLMGLGGDDYLAGGQGDDILQGGTGDDALDGGTAGNDTADFSDATSDGLVVDLVAGTASGGGLDDDTLLNIDNITGSSFNDSLTGDTNNNVLKGGAGDDTLDGGGGIDTADYSDATSNGLIVNLMGSVSSGGGLGNDSLFNIQNVSGSSFNDILIGDDGGNTLVGGAGNDILYGHGGNNTLSGGDGMDVAYYSGLESDPTYHITGLSLVTGGPDAVNDLLSVERLKFLSPSHVSDVNNDGLADLVYQNGNSIEVGGTVLAPVGPGNPALPAAFTVVGTGQFNPDNNRNSDILVQDTGNGHLQLLQDISGGAPGSSVDFSGAALTGTNYNSSWKAIATGDFNGDASWDVLLQNQSAPAPGASKAVEIFTVYANEGEGAGQVSAVTSVAAPSGANWNPIAAGDFNGDGKSDILWQNSANKAVEITLEGTTPTNTAALGATNLTAVATGDFNGDGFSDILFKNTTGQAVVWFMNGGAHTGTKTITHAMQTGATWAVAGAADVDGNGYSDVIWSDPSSTAPSANGVASASLMSGSAANPTVNTINLTPAGSNFHLIATGGG